MRRLPYSLTAKDATRAWRRMAVAWLGLSAMATLLAGCSLIDDDLDDCGTVYALDYELQLVTNINLELQAEQQTGLNPDVAAALRQHLSTIFTDFAHDVDLSFYDTQGDSARLHHDEHVMDANQASYSLFLPKRQYMHLAVANVADNSLVTLVDDERCHSSWLRQQPDTIGSHTTGLFTARQPMDVLEGVDQQFHVKLYMANCAAALVIDPRGHSLDGAQVYTTGFATGFRVADSAYVFPATSPMVRTTRIDAGGQVSFCSVSFPSRESGSTRWGKPTGTDGGTTTRSVIETEDPFVSDGSAKALWQFRAYVPKGDGTITETVLSLHRPLRAGQFEVVRAFVTEDGVVMTEDQTVGVSVTLDWKKGNNYEVPL